MGHEELKQRMVHSIEQLESRRLLAAGQVDPTYGFLGTANAPSAAATSYPIGLFPALDGGVLAIFNMTKKQSRLVHLNSDGSLDTAFGNGKRINGSGAEQIEQDLTSGRVAVLRRVLGTTSFYLAVLHSDGTTDEGFDTDGIRSLDDIGFTGGGSMRFDSQGRLVIAAQLTDGSVRMARFDNEGMLDPDFGGGGSVKLKLGLETLSGFGLTDDDNFTLVGFAHSQAHIYRVADDGTFISAAPITGAADAYQLVVRPDGETWFVTTQPNQVMLCEMPAGSHTPVKLELGNLSNALLEIDPQNRALITGFDPTQTSNVVRRFVLSNDAIVQDHGYGTASQFTVPQPFVRPSADGTAYTMQYSDNDTWNVTRIQGGNNAGPGSAKLAGGVLTISGTAGDDSIILNAKPSKGQYVAHVNSFTRAFRSSAIKSVKIVADKGDDAVAIDNDVIGVTINGNDGRDTLIGGDGNDSITGDLNPDKLFGGLGNDTLSGGGGNDYLLGAAGKDFLSGNGGKDTLSGAGGDDVLFGGPLTADKIYGGSGNDEAAEDALDTYDSVEELLKSPT
jgi:Ca2+-binding RTX toxin-like protein